MKLGRNKPSTIARAAMRPAAPASSGPRLDVVLPRGFPQSAGKVSWRWQRRSGDTQTGDAARLADLPGGATAGPVFVWTPAADTVLTEARLPTTSRARIAQALPYALEDQLLGDPEQLNFSWRREADDRLSVAVTSRERLQAWTDALVQARLKPRSLCPVTLAVPLALDCWSAAFLGDELLVRRGEVSGFVCPAAVDAPPTLLVAAMQEASRLKQAPECLVLFHSPKGLRADAWQSALGVPVRVERASIWEAQTGPHVPINLLGRERAASPVSMDALRPYLVAAVALTVWMIGSIAFDATEWWRLKRQQTQATEEMTRLLREVFPETRAVLDPAIQMQRNLEALQAKQGAGNVDFLPLLARTTTVLRASPRVRVRGLRYADRALTLELTWPTPASPEALRAALEAAGLRAEVLAVTPRAGEVDGRVRLYSDTKSPAKTSS